MPPRWMLRIALAVAAIALAGADDSSCETSTDQPVESSSPDSAGADKGSDAAVPEPDGRFNLNCDYLLGDFGESGDLEQGYRFVAGGTIVNTGNVGIVVRVRARWELLGSEPVVEERRLRLRTGRTKRVNISHPVTQNEIDAHQSADADCSTKVKMLDTFGKAE